MLKLIPARPAARVLAAAATVVLAASGTTAFAAAGGRQAGGFGPSPTGEHTVQPLKHKCETGRPEQLCRNIGVSDAWYDGHDVQFLYTQNYYCDPSVQAGSDSGCEVGQKFNQVPPGTTSEAFTDPLYFPVPLFSPTPRNLQCPPGPCIDHPDTIDLSRIAGALGKSPDALENVPLPGHDHIISGRNMDLPEWWPVYVVGVTDPASFSEIEHDKDYATLQRLAADLKAGVSAPIPTNVFLWFQTLPGTDDHCPC